MSHITPGNGGHITPQATSAEAPKPVLWQSSMRRGKRVAFPAFDRERVYMQPFLKTHGEVLLPSKLSHWTPTVATMLDEIETRAVMYLMIDQSDVPAGFSQRRPGPHIDGTWSERDGGGCRLEDFKRDELVVLASDVLGCVAYLGDYDPNAIRSGGDCSSVDLSKLTKLPLVPGHVWIGNAATIHESIPVTQACQRTLVRINVPIP